MLNTSRIMAAALLGLIFALLAIGVVSGTPLRHFIQILPSALALALVIRRVPWTLYASLPIFVIWFLIMVAIWLFLLDLARIAKGHFSPAEVALTLLVGASCLCGLSQTLRTQPIASRVTRTVWAIVFTALQVLALWISLRPAFAHI
jgi:hypothetical protein